MKKGSSIRVSVKIKKSGLIHENGDFIEPHTDGNNLGRLCVILAYLSDIEDYNDGGGKLIIRDKDNNTHEVLPVKGNYVMLDFTNHNINHAVEVVKNDFERYCYLSFIYNTDVTGEAQVKY